MRECRVGGRETETEKGAFLTESMNEYDDIPQHIVIHVICVMYRWL